MPENLTVQILDPDPSDAAVVGNVLGARGDIQFEEDGSVETIVDGQTEIDITFLYEKVSADYRWIENYIESPIANLSDVRCIVRKEDRKTTGFKVQLSSEHVPAGSIYRWHIKVRDALQVTQPPESQPRYILSDAFQPVSAQLTMLSTLPVQDFGLGALNIGDEEAFRTYIGAAATSDLGGPYVPTSRTITEGAGLAGNTYSLVANRTLAMGTPSTLTVATTNSASGTTHSHAITSSSNPGAAASILASDASGFLILPRFTATGYIFVNNATANLYLKDTSTGFRSATTGIVTLQSGNKWQSTAFTSGLQGFYQDDFTGNAEFNNVRVRGELASSVFKVSEISATAGTFGVFPSASTLTADVTTPSTLSTSFTFHAKNSDAGGMLFSVGNILRIKSWTAGGIKDSWATVASRTNNGTSTTYAATLNSGSTNATFTAGTAIVDYAQTGAGFITLSTDGTVGSSPNLTMATHSGTPWSGFTTLLRLGNLNNSYGYVTDTYGLGVGNFGGTEWFTVDPTNGLRLNAAGGDVKIDSTGLYLRVGADTSNSVMFRTSGDAERASIYTSDITGITNMMYSASTGSSTGYSALNFITANDLGDVPAQFVVKGLGSAFATTPGKGYAYLAGGSLTSLLGFTVGSDAAPTHMLEVYGTGYFTGALAFLVGGAIKTAEVGAADSGGAGYKMLRVPN